MNRWGSFADTTRKKQEAAAREAEKRRARDRRAFEDELARELAKLKDPLKQGELFPRAPRAEKPPRATGAA